MLCANVVVGPALRLCREERCTAPGTRMLEPPQHAAGVFFCRNRMDNRPRRFHRKSRKAGSSETMTDRRPLLRTIFDAAVAAAHPDVVLAAHLRPVPKGR